MTNETMPELPVPAGALCSHPKTPNLLVLSDFGGRVENFREAIKDLPKVYLESDVIAYARSYAAQQVAKEREACARMLDQRRDNTAFADFEDAYREIANDIRARSQP